MKKFVIFGVLAASVGLAACGVTASLNQAVTSLGASPNVQVHLTATASGSQSASVQKVLGLLSFDFDYSNPSGAPLSKVTSDLNADIIANVASQQLFDIRLVGDNAYFLVDASALAKIPGTNIPASELATVQLLLGGRWFELPASLLKSYEAQDKALAQQLKKSSAVTKEQAIERRIIDALTGVIEATPYKTLPGGGYAQTGTLESIVKAELPIIKSLEPTATLPTNVKGSYTVAFTMSGSTATGASIGVTAPNGTKGNATLTLNATVAHATAPIVAPANPTIITPALLKGLLSQAA